MEAQIEPKQLTDDELWAFVENWSKNPRPIDPAEVGLRRKDSPYGYETFYEGDPFGLDKPGGGIFKRILRFIVR